MLAVISRELAPVGCVRLTGFLSGRTKILFILLLEKGPSGDIYTVNLVVFDIPTQEDEAKIVLQIMEITIPTELGLELL
jgi:hypothetical protein